MVHLVTSTTMTWATLGDLGNSWSLGLKPGVAVNVDKFSFVAHIGFVGYENFKPEGGDASSVWGVDFDGNNISLGVYYNF